MTKYIKSSSGTLEKFRFPSLKAYSIVAKRGNRLDFGLLSLKCYSAPDKRSRFCFIVKTKKGGAVFRNRCRRVLRPIFLKKTKKFMNKFWVMVFVEMEEQTANWTEFRKTAKIAMKNLTIPPVRRQTSTNNSA